MTVKLSPGLEKFLGAKGGLSQSAATKEFQVVTKDISEAVFLAVKNDIVASALAGKDVDGASFTPYSTSEITMRTTKAGQVGKPYVPAKPSPRKIGKGRMKTRVFPDGEGYAKYKQETHGDSHPTLRNTGRMFSSIHWRRMRGKGGIIEIFIRNKQDNDVGFWNQQTRKWWGYTTKAKRAVTELIRQNLWYKK